MPKPKTRLELTWIGKENRPKLEPRVLIEDPEKSYHASHRISENAAGEDGDGEMSTHQDAIDQQREGLIGKIEKQLKHSNQTQTLFTVRWSIR